MSLIEPILNELNRESRATLQLLERVPEDFLRWRPHAKSMSLGQLALHIAEVPGMVVQMVQTEGIQLPDFHQPEATSRRQSLDTYRSGLQAARSYLPAMTDAKLLETWTVRRGDQVLMSMTRLELLRTLLLNHQYHHRGQLTVYLRLLDVPLPSVYGPSADESPFG